MMQKQILPRRRWPWCERRFSWRRTTIVSTHITPTLQDTAIPKIHGSSTEIWSCGAHRTPSGHALQYRRHDVIRESETALRARVAANFFSETNTCPPRWSHSAAPGLDVLGLAARARIVSLAAGDWAKRRANIAAGGQRGLRELACVITLSYHLSCCGTAIGTTIVDASVGCQSDALAIYRIVALRVSLFQMWQLGVREEGLIIAAAHVRGARCADKLSALPHTFAGLRFNA